MLFGTRFLVMIWWCLLTVRTGLFWSSVFVPYRFSKILRGSLFILFVVLLFFAVEHRKFRASFVFWDALGNGRLFRFGVKLLFWQFHYFILYLDIFWVLVYFLLLLFLFVLFFLFLHELIYFYHVFLCDFVDLEWFFRLSHILEGLIFFPW